jgi:hypothetical protein
MPLQRKTSKRKISRRKTRRRQHKNLFRRKRKNITYSLKGGTFMSRLNHWSQSQSQKQTPPPTKPATAQAQPPPPQKQEQPQEQPQTSSPPWWFWQPQEQPQKPDLPRGTTPKDQTYSPYDTEPPEQSKSWVDWWSGKGSA